MTSDGGGSATRRRERGLMGCDVAVDVDEGVIDAGGRGEVEEDDRAEVLCLGEVVGGALTTGV